jgi:SAM-dependent methyltransferase
MFDRLSGAVEMVESVGARSALDVGCGSGPLFEPLAGRGIKVTGFDPAPAMIALAQQRASAFPDLVVVEGCSTTSTNPVISWPEWAGPPLP